MVDATTSHSSQANEIWPEFVGQLPDSLPVTVIRNKVDMTGEPVTINTVNGQTLIGLSAKTGLDMDLLRQHLKQSIGFNANIEGGFIARRRHLQALQLADTHLLQGRQQLLQARAGELLAEELRQAQQALSEITGQFSSDDLFGRIFSSFGIGK